MTPATDSLPDLGGEVTLAPEQIAAWQRDGHTLVRGVADDGEVAAYRPIIVEETLRQSAERRPLAERDTYHRAFIQVTNLWRKSEAVKRFVLARRFAKIAADLMGVDAVRIYHDQALLKEGGGGHTPWHQDQFYWPLDTDNTITMWMPLVDCPVEMGALTFASSRDALGYRSEMPISDDSHREIASFIAKNHLPIVVGDLRAGDATFHSGWCLHSAPPNRSDRMREVMTVIYYEDGARLKSPESEHERVDREAWYPGSEPGDLAASELTPVVFHR
ncbi:phytanoyl-CoA dioxygenase family protein [Candidatus Sumerlaeota bacterium]|nr:phytanoyl-CoA dioxygenase family protein [Candidatus Sumerlaeota bacterium]